MPSPPAPYDPFGYSTMIHDALRSVVRKTLLEVKEFGMPTDHHFYITFKTMAPQVVLPLYLRQKYPESMTIVLQYQFYNLTITDSVFSVALSFGGKFETLTVPFSAIDMFSDPEAQLVLNFEPSSEPLSSSEQHPAKHAENRQENHAENLTEKQVEKLRSDAKNLTKSPSQNSAKAWHGSIAYSAQKPPEPPLQKTKLQSKPQDKDNNKDKDRLKSVATKTSARVLTFRPKNTNNTNAPHSAPPPPSKTP